MITIVTIGFLILALLIFMRLPSHGHARHTVSRRIEFIPDDEMIGDQHDETLMLPESEYEVSIRILPPEQPKMLSDGK